jgi:hypothetical protein
MTALGQPETSLPFAIPYSDRKDRKLHRTLCQPTILSSRLWPTSI